VNSFRKRPTSASSVLRQNCQYLATEATALMHGREAAAAAAETARRTFEEGALAETLPSVEVARAAFEAGLGVVDLGPAEPLQPGDLVERQQREQLQEAADIGVLGG
jgi:tyrosyl-tRNA synthetase